MARRVVLEQNIKQLLARELHDRVAQTLTSMLVELENFKASQVGRQSVLLEVDGLQDSTRDVLNELRGLFYELRGEEGMGDSFVDKVRLLIARFHEKTSIEAHLSVQRGWPARLRPQIALNVYRIIEEALANVRMHSGANAVRVALKRYSLSHLAVEVRDDGRGVDTDESRLVGMGTVGMRERAVILGGKLQIESFGGHGTKVLAIFPKELVPIKDLISPQELLVPEISA